MNTKSEFDLKGIYFVFWKVASVKNDGMYVHQPRCKFIIHSEFYIEKKSETETEATTHTQSD